jgi:hypothetical protein
MVSLASIKIQIFQDFISHSSLIPKFECHYVANFCPVQIQFRLFFFNRYLSIITMFKGNHTIL